MVSTTIYYYTWDVLNAIRETTDQSMILGGEFEDIRRSKGLIETIAKDAEKGPQCLTIHHTAEGHKEDHPLVQICCLDTGASLCFTSVPELTRHGWRVEAGERRR